MNFGHIVVDSFDNPYLIIDDKNKLMINKQWEVIPYKETHQLVVKGLDQMAASIENSILKWKKNTIAKDKAEMDVSWQSCALCNLYLHQSHSCYGCPIYEKTGEAFCDGTPYTIASKIAHREFVAVQNILEFQTASLDMVDFLISLRKPWWEILEEVAAPAEIKSDRWTRTHTSHNGRAQVELRANFAADLLIIVALGGWSYKNETPSGTKRYGTKTAGYDVRVSTNGVLNLTLSDWKEINEEVRIAVDHLRSLKGK